MITDWTVLKGAFYHYIQTTTGLFTLINPRDLQYFNLDGFLERMIEISNPLSLSQVEMIMSLATFLIHHECNKTLNSKILPKKVRLQFKALIERNVLQLNPFSQVKKTCLESSEFPVFHDSPTAAAA